MMGWMQSRRDRSSIVLKAIIIADSNSVILLILLKIYAEIIMVT